MNIYVGRAFSGFSYNYILEYYNVLEQELGTFYTILRPIVAHTDLKGTEIIKSSGYKEISITDKSIYRRDKWMITTLADILFIDLSDATNISIGCLLELIIAEIAGKHTVVVMDKNKLNSHAFINEAADLIFNDRAEAIKYLRNLSLTED